MNYLLIIILLLIIIIDRNNAVQSFSMKNAKATMSYDKRIYKVADSFTDYKNASDMMANVNIFIIDFLRYVRQKYIIDNKGTIEQRDFYKLMIKRYNPDVLFENNPKPGDDTSYILSKGLEFGVCLREKESGFNRFHNIDLVKFVILHELSHLGTTSFNHEDDFWLGLQWATIDAYDAGIYIPIDYSKKPAKYCGITITDNPYFNKN